MSFSRLKLTTDWNFKKLNNNSILEVGSGAGRFSREILKNTSANLFSVDFSDSVFSNYENNKDFVKDKSNFSLFRASIYKMPFKRGSFDKVLCLGVLQHTPNIDESIKCLIEKTKPGGEIVTDFYPLKGWWTKIHAKYLLRPFLKKLNNERLLKLIKMFVPFFYCISLALNKTGLGILSRFIPICDIRTMPKNVTNLRDWIVLDTFDMFSAEYDEPQKIKNVVKIFKKYKTKITFSGYININGTHSAVVRAQKFDV